MGVGGGKFVGARAKVRRCVEEGAQRRVSGGGYGLALVWVVAGEGVLRWVRGGEDVWRKVRCGGRGRMGVEGRKYAHTWAKVRCGG